MTYIDFNRIRIVPRITTVKSRKNIDTSVSLGEIRLDVPVMAPPMKAIYTSLLAKNLEGVGSLAVVPRDVFFDKNLKQVVVNSSLDTALKVADELSELKIPKALSIEIANGYMMRLSDTIKRIKDRYPQLSVWAGTVCTAEGVNFLGESGADFVLIGIGVGSACITTNKTGIGLPAWATALECSQTPYPVILTGGIKEIGDVAKAIVAGCSAVYVGNLLKGVLDSASPDKYWGEASKTAKKDGHYIEGIEQKINPKNIYSDIIVSEIKEGLQSSMSYCDSYNLKEFYSKAKYIVLD